MTIIDRINILEDNTITLQGEMVDEQATTKDLTVQVNSLESTAVTVKGRLTDIETTQSDLTTQVDALQIQVDTIEGAFGSHEGKAKKLKDRLNRIDSSITTVDTRVSSLETSVSSVSVQVTDLDTRVYTLEGTEVNEMALGAPAESLEYCVDGCTDCRKGYYSFYPNFPIYQCVDMTVYKYGDECATLNSGKWSTEWCATGPDQWCHKSYPMDDPLGMNSPDAGCRTVPKAFIDSVFYWDFGPPCDDQYGLCIHGCGNNACVLGWPSGDPLKTNSPEAMCVCRNW